MGVNYSDLQCSRRKEKDTGRNNNIPKFDPCDPEPLLSEKDGELLRHVWENLKDDIHKVGVITFVRYVHHILNRCLYEQ